VDVNAEPADIAACKSSDEVNNLEGKSEEGASSSVGPLTSDNKSVDSSKATGNLGMVNSMRSPMSMGFGNSNNNFGYPQNGMGMSQ
jgi:hypothetical protein